MLVKVKTISIFYNTCQVGSFQQKYSFIYCNVYNMFITAFIDCFGQASQTTFSPCCPPPSLPPAPSPLFYAIPATSQVLKCVFFFKPHLS